MIQPVSAPGAPQAIGPYSHAYTITCGERAFIFTSGQIPINPETETIPDGIRNQTEQACKNVDAVLRAAGGSLETVIKTTCFLADMNDFPSFNDIYAAYFTSLPARSCVAVRSLPKDVLVEIEAIATVSE